MKNLNKYFSYKTFQNDRFLQHKKTNKQSNAFNLTFVHGGETFEITNHTFM